MKAGSAWMAAAAAVAALTGCAGAAGKLTEFSAAQVHLDKAGAERGKTLLFMDGDRVRTETAMPEGRGTMVTIFRKDKQRLYMLNPAGKVYFEKELAEEDLAKALGGMVSEQNARDLGSETVNGFKCDKKEVETTVTIMGFKRTSRSIVWRSDKLDMPLRVQQQDGGMTEIRDIKPGRQPASLFEVPGGYERVENLFAVMAAGAGPAAGDGADPAADRDKPSAMASDFNEMMKKIKLPFGPRPAPKE